MKNFLIFLNIFTIPGLIIQGFFLYKSQEALQDFKVQNTMYETVNNELKEKVNLLTGLFIKQSKLLEEYKKQKSCEDERFAKLDSLLTKTLESKIKSEKAPKELILLSVDGEFKYVPKDTIADSLVFKGILSEGDTAKTIVYLDKKKEIVGVLSK